MNDLDCAQFCIALQLDLSDFNSVMLLFHLAKLQYEEFSIGLGIALDFRINQPPLSFDATRRQLLPAVLKGP